jgi:hypothetical protein
MRMLMIAILTVSMTGPALAGLLNGRDRGNQWFQDCEEEIARPFCGTLKVDPAVQSLAWQWIKQSPLDDAPANQPTASYLNHEGNEASASESASEHEQERGRTESSAEMPS